MKKKKITKKNKNISLKTGECKMATQIAPTPIVKGSQAVEIMKQIQRQRTEKSMLGAKKIMEMFNAKK